VINLDKSVENIELSVDERIVAETKRLKRLLNKLDLKTRKLVQNSIINAAFMAITLENLQEIINKEGTTCEYQNGKNQFGMKQTPEVDIYNRMIKNYNSTIKQLTDLLPKKNIPVDDGFNKFINSK